VLSKTGLTHTSAELSDDVFVVSQNVLVNAAEWNAPGEAVSHDQSIKRIARPAQFQRPLRYRRKGNIVKSEPWIFHKLPHEVRVVDTPLSHLCKYLYFKNRYR
jgi:hypothetical protein